MNHLGNLQIKIFFWLCILFLVEQLCIVPIWKFCSPSSIKLPESLAFIMLQQTLYLFFKYLLNTYCVPSSVLGIREVNSWLEGLISICKTIRAMISAVFYFSSFKSMCLLDNVRDHLVAHHKYSIAHIPLACKDLHTHSTWMLPLLKQ